MHKDKNLPMRMMPPGFRKLCELEEELETKRSYCKISNSLKLILNEDGTYLIFKLNMNICNVKTVLISIGCMNRMKN